MSKLNEYPSVNNPEEFTQEQKAAFLGSANVISTGTKGGSTVTANIPFTEIAPPVSLSQLTDDITVDTYDATSEAPISGKGVSSALANFGGFQVVSLTSGANPVPDVASPSNKLIYLTKETSAKTDPYTEWIYTGDPTSALDVSKWEVIGETTVDLSNYYTKGQADTAIETAIDSIAPVQNSVLYGGGSGGYNKRMDLLYDNTLTKVSGANGYELKVAVPVPSPGINAHRGEVLTVNNSDEAVWAAPQGGGGGSSLPAYTSDDDCAVLAVNSTHDGCEWIGYPSLGSAGEHGYSPVLRTRIDYIVPYGQPIEDGEWVNSTTFTNPGLPYRYITGEDSNASNDWAYGKSWTISGNKAIAEIDNEMLCSMEDLDPEYGDSDFENVTEIEIRILINSPLLPPFATIEFTNKTGNTVTVTCSHGKKVNGTYKKWEQGIDYMYGSPLKLISLCGTTKSNSIPTNTFVQLQLLGTGYRLYTE